MAKKKKEIKRFLEADMITQEMTFIDDKGKKTKIKTVKEKPSKEKEKGD